MFADFAGSGAEADYPIRHYRGGEPRRFTWDEYLLATEGRLFGTDERVQFIDGILIDGVNGGPYRWDRARYYRAMELGVLIEGERSELLEGQIVRKPRLSRPHVVSIKQIVREMEGQFGTEHTVHSQSPMQAGPFSEPEPDVMVVGGTLENYDDHPTAANTVVVVEVSDGSSWKYRQRKTALYAACGVEELWRLDLPTRALEIRREPSQDPNGLWLYRRRLTYPEIGEVGLSCPTRALVNVSDLLPLRKS